MGKGIGRRSVGDVLSSSFFPIFFSSFDLSRVVLEALLASLRVGLHCIGYVDGPPTIIYVISRRK